MRLDWTSGQLEAFAAMNPTSALPEATQRAVCDRFVAFVRALPRPDYQRDLMLAAGAWGLVKFALRGMGPWGVAACLLAGWVAGDLVERHLPAPAAPAEIPLPVELELLGQLEAPTPAARDAIRALWRELARVPAATDGVATIGQVGRAVAPGPTRILTTLAGVLATSKRQKA
jgi:hypothetical protein